MDSRWPGPVLHAPAELQQPGVAVEPVARIAGARVVFADYALIQHDFPQLRAEHLVSVEPALRDLDDARRPAAVRRFIDAWLLQNAAVISQAQAAQSIVNTPISTTGEWTTALRPPGYGRALVRAPVDGPLLPGVEPGLLDLKGAGVAPDRVPSPRGHADGLIALGEALANFTFQRLLDLIFRRAGTAFCAVPEYAILDLGFDLRGPGGETTPAGMQLRRAHRRPVGGGDLPAAGTVEQQVKLEIEMLLRHYGITSCNESTGLLIGEEGGQLLAAYGGGPAFADGKMPADEVRRLTGFERGRLRFDGVNIQLTREVELRPSRAHVVDFGHYSVRDRFDAPVLSLVHGRLLRWGGAIRPDSALFVQPDPRLALPRLHWGTPAEPPPESAAPRHPGLIWPRPFELAFEWARDFRLGRISGDGVRARINAQLATATAHWAERASDATAR